jgi:hypothetical protein
MNSMAGRRETVVNGFARAVVALLIALGSVDAAAHGGLTMEKDVCKLKLGPYAMHFTGYQPESAGTKEFCEDIPEVGNTMVTLDAIDDALRTIPIGVRIIRDTGDESNLEAVTVLHIAPVVYPAGAVPFVHRFDQGGKYVGLVTAGDKGQYVSRFPFSVGVSTPKYSTYLPIVGVLLGGLALYFFSGWRHRKSDRNGQQTV